MFRCAPPLIAASANASKLSPNSTKEMHISTAEEILNKQSGWKAVAGTTDFQVITEERVSKEECKLAFDVFVDRILGFVGSYYVKLDGGVDALVFAGGIGEKSKELREAVMARTGCLGFKLDHGKNAGADGEDGVVVDIGGEESGGKRTLVVRTDEQFEMARGCLMHPDLARG